MTPDELQQEPAVQGLMRVARNACDRINELENEVAVLKAALFQAQQALATARQNIGGEQ